MLRLLLSLLVPGRCLGCRARGRDLCADCARELEEARPVEAAVVVDRGVAARIVRIGKSSGARVAARLMGDRTLRHLREQRLDGVDAVTWVPHDERRGQSRGYHLPACYADVVAAAIGVPAVPLLRRHGGHAQRGSDLAARQANAARSFALDPARAMPPGATVLLLDDVRTSGATLAACTDLLRDAGLHVEPLAFSGVP